MSEGGKMVVQPYAGPNKINIPCRLSLGHSSGIFSLPLYMLKKKKYQVFVKYAGHCTEKFKLQFSEKMSLNQMSRWD